MAANRTILIRVNESGLYEERNTSAEIKPGMNAVLAAGNTVAPGAAAGNSMRICYEKNFQGGTVDTPVAAGDVAFLYQAMPGDRLNLLLTDGQTITRGGGLKFAASGKLVTDGGTGTEFEAEESLSPVGADALIACRRI